MDPEIKEIMKETSLEKKKSKLDLLIVRKEKKIFEELSLLLNAVRNKKMSEMDLIDRVLLVCSMYFLPSIYKYLFTEFLPSLMKDSNSYNYDSLLIRLQRLVSKLTVPFNSSTIAYENLYLTKNDSSIMKLQSKLFSTIFSGKPKHTGDGYMLHELMEDNYKLSQSILSPSPSIFFSGLHSIKLESQAMKCIHYISSFMEKFLPVFFIKVSQLDNILVFFEMIFKLDQNSIRKITLHTFCQVNLSFLQFWSILRLQSDTTGTPYIQNLMKTIFERYLSFNVNYFSWTIFTSDCYKEYNNEDSMERIITDLKSLYFIHSNIKSFYKTPESHPYDMEKVSNIYGVTFKKISYFSSNIEVAINKVRSNLSLRKISNVLNNNSYIYLNVSLVETGIAT